MRCRTMLLGVFMVMIAGCGSGGGGSESADQLVADGWTAYLSHNYAGASSKFSQALALNGNLVDAYNGSGWSLAKLNLPDSAVTQFNKGLNRDTANAEIRAGLAFVDNALKLYSQSITLALAVLQGKPSWVFSRDNSVNALDLHLLLAEDYFALASYTESLTQIQILNPSFAADVSTVTGQTSLAKEIERQRALL